MAFVYHGSTVQNLTEIIPHKNRLIYAVKDKTISAMFIRDTRRGHGSFSRSIGHEQGIPFIVERYKNALDDLYKNVSGSIYVLQDSSFMPDKLKWQMVSKDKQPVIQEIKINDVKEFLIDLEKQNKLKIYCYPSRPKFIPQDDSDLIKEVLSFNSPDKLQEFQEIFPDLYEKHKEILDKIKV